MAIYFFDTSALVKRYVSESGSAWVIAQCQLEADHIIASRKVSLTIPTPISQDTHITIKTTVAHNHNHPSNYRQKGTFI